MKSYHTLSCFFPAVTPATLRIKLLPPHGGPRRPGVWMLPSSPWVPLLLDSPSTVAYIPDSLLPQGPCTGCSFA